jgi:ATP-dependent Clp protease adapter protein ClpS
MSTKKDTDRGTAIAEPEAKIKTEPPKLYKVLLHNDDYTPRNFVVMVLVQVFRMGGRRGGRCHVARPSIGARRGRPVQL